MFPHSFSVQRLFSMPNMLIDAFEILGFQMPDFSVCITEELRPVGVAHSLPAPVPQIRMAFSYCSSLTALATQAEGA